MEDLEDHLIQVVSLCDCRFCLVDQLDLFAEPRPRLEQEQIAHLSKTLKQQARDLQIVILCLVQLNRAALHRTALLDRRPILSDLRFSGRLEQDADTVLFVHRPCLYQATYPLPPQVPNPHWSQYTEVIAAKVRDGASGEVLPLCFTGSFASFSDWPHAWELPQFEE